MVSATGSSQRLHMPALILPCPACRTSNRLPSERLGDRPVCASCKAPLLGAVVPLGDTDFDRVVAAVNVPIVVDFWAGWCGPCRAMAPQFAAAAAELPGRFCFAKVDTDAAPRTAARFAIQSIPTLVLLDGGRELRRSSGAMSKAQLLAWLGQ